MTCPTCRHYRPDRYVKSGACAHPSEQEGREKAGLLACVVVLRRTDGQCFAAKEKTR